MLTAVNCNVGVGKFSSHILTPVRRQARTKQPSDLNDENVAVSRIAPAVVALE